MQKEEKTMSGENDTHHLLYPPDHHSLISYSATCASDIDYHPEMHLALSVPLSHDHDLLS